MRAIKWMLIVSVMLLALTDTVAQKKGEKTVVFNATLHCASCKAKLEKNIPFEKGVKDLKVDLEKKTVTITFREDKNTEENLRKAIEKLGFQVTNETPAATPASSKECCKETKK